ncbi:DNA polymerase III subunit delta [Tenericutes bacterium MO-XQ]|nr:DNA polymerase III subunit delta [Tenericutes bacterium MO-XQ]
MAEAIYVFQSQNEYLLHHSVEEKIKKLNVDPFNIMRYDLLESKSEDILEDMQTISFFSEQKIIVIKNIQLLDKETEDVFKKWVQYFEKPNPDVFVIIEQLEVLPKNSQTNELLMKHAYIEKIDDMRKEEYPEFVKNMFKKFSYTITDEAVSALLERTNFDFNLLSQEAEKLMLFSYDSKEIHEKEVILLVSRNLEENIFELTNALLAKDQAKTIEIFYDLVARNEDPLRILNFIVNKVRELIHAKLLIEKGYRQDEVADHFNIKSGRAYYLVKNAQKADFNILETHLKKLSKLDYDIKSGKIDKKLGLELYLLGA